MKKALSNKIDSTVATAVIVGGVLLASFGFASAAPATHVDNVAPTTSITKVAKNLGGVGSESLGQVSNSGGEFAK